MTRSLTTLSKKLASRHTIDPFVVLNEYNGKDWKNIKSLYPNSLWKNDYMELYIRKWTPGERFIYSNNYSTVHTKVLEGKFLSKMIIDDSTISISRYINKDENYTFHPFSKVLFTTIEPSISIQLYYHHHLY